MPSPADSTLLVAPGRSPRSVRHDGVELEVPAGWERLPPGDAGLTRRVKAGGPCWTVQEKRGRKTFSQGVWAPAERIAAARAAVESTRADPAYQRRLDADRRRREVAQAAYVQEFEGEVRRFLDFAPRFVEQEGALAAAVAAHATPVGSGTVARTERIPVQDRARAAVMAWLRHQTTGYDRMQIKRVKGRRREVRRELAQQSRALLESYRRGEDPPPSCPLQRALSKDPEAPREALAPRPPLSWGGTTRPASAVVEAASADPVDSARTGAASADPVAAIEPASADPVAPAATEAALADPVALIGPASAAPVAPTTTEPAAADPIALTAPRDPVAPTPASSADQAADPSAAQAAEAIRRRDEAQREAWEAMRARMAQGKSRRRRR